MSDQPPLLGEGGRIAKITFELMEGFDSRGQPAYRKGVVESAAEREKAQSVLAPLRPSPHTIASVTMGEVVIELEDGRAFTIRPVYHPSSDAYRDLFMVDEWQYPLPPAFAELLDRWRGKTP